MNLPNLCHCGERLSLDDVGAEGHASVFRCHCRRCWERAQRGEGDGFIVAVDGFGSTPQAAVDDYRARVHTF